MKNIINILIMLSYGEIARINGIKFEEEVYNQLLISKNIPKYINSEDFQIQLISNKKVKSIINNKKTTAKSDIIIISNGIQYPISIKMSNKGTQLQIISLNNFKYYCIYNNISFNQDIEYIFKKFLGIIEPNKQELIELNKKRKGKSIGEKRFWLNELSTKEQIIIELFIFINKIKLIKFCLQDGMCYENKYKPKLFILNNSSYTETKKISYSWIDYETMVIKMGEGVPRITKNGNLQLSKYIGVQRKGSGNNLNHKNSIQFKDRGFLNIFKNIYRKNETKWTIFIFLCWYC
jgi:hypothetical protein